jgi:ArsR family transcriptional regulator
MAGTTLFTSKVTIDRQGTNPMVTTHGEVTLDEAVETLKFLSDRNRLRIVMALTQAETCVCDLIDELDLPQPLVSYHLGKLRKAGLVRSRRQAQWIYYSIDPEIWQTLTRPLAPLFDSMELPPAARYGASHRCDSVPADPTHGACDDEDRAIGDVH